MWFALSGSASISFCISILLDSKIHPHDIVFSSFTVIDLSYNREELHMEQLQT